MSLPQPYVVTLDKPKLNILLYGNQGVGKTTLAASAQDHPEMAPVLLLNFEGGTLSLTSRGDIHALNITSITQMDELFWAIRNGSAPYNQYRTLIFDSGSEMQTLALEETARKEIAKKPSKDRTIDDMELGTYGTAGAQLSRLFRWFRDLPVHTIITALPKVTFPQGTTDKTGAPKLVAPMFTDRLATQVMGYVDMVWYMGDDGSGRKFLITRDTGPYRAKTRGFNFGNALGPIYSDPWMPQIYELLLSSEQSSERAQAPAPNQVPVSVPITSVPIFDDLETQEVEEVVV